MKSTEEKLLEEINIAMKDTPGMCLIDLITRVTEFTHATRCTTNGDWYVKKAKAKWRMTNKSLLDSFTLYNKVRANDSRRIS